MTVATPTKYVTYTFGFEGSIDELFEGFKSDIGITDFEYPDSTFQSNVAMRDIQHSYMHYSKDLEEYVSSPDHLFELKEEIDFWRNFGVQEYEALYEYRYAIEYCEEEDKDFEEYTSGSSWECEYAKKGAVLQSRIDQFKQLKTLEDAVDLIEARYDTLQHLTANFEVLDSEGEWIPLIKHLQFAFVNDQCSFSYTWKGIRYSGDIPQLVADFLDSAESGEVDMDDYKHLYERD